MRHMFDVCRLAAIVSLAGCFFAMSVVDTVNAQAPVAGDAIAQSDEAVTPLDRLSEDDVNDPFEPVNRVIFEFNVGLDKAILRPTAIAYREVLPLGARRSVTDFLDNLETPVVLLNDILQFKLNRAGITVSRFAINTTIGFFGFFDPAEELGLARHDEDFAQTLGYWGIPEGPYLMWPLLGPLPPRDAVGFMVDRLTNPVDYALRDELLLDGAIFATDLVDVRHQVIDEIDELERTSVDYYAAVRSLYRQSIRDEIRDGAPDFDQLPDFDFPEDDMPAAEPVSDGTGEQPALQNGEQDHVPAAPTQEGPEMKIPDLPEQGFPLEGMVEMSPASADLLTQASY